MSTPINKKSNADRTKWTPEGFAWFRARVPEDFLIELNVLNAKRRPENFSDTIELLLRKGFEKFNEENSCFVE